MAGSRTESYSLTASALPPEARCVLCQEWRPIAGDCDKHLLDGTGKLASAWLSWWSAKERVNEGSLGSSEATNGNRPRRVLPMCFECFGLVKEVPWMENRLRSKKKQLLQLLRRPDNSNSSENSTHLDVTSPHTNPVVKPTGRDANQKPTVKIERVENEFALSGWNPDISQASVKVEREPPVGTVSAKREVAKVVKREPAAEARSSRHTGLATFVDTLPPLQPSPRISHTVKSTLDRKSSRVSSSALERSRAFLFVQTRTSQFTVRKDEASLPGNECPGFVPTRRVHSKTGSSRKSRTLNEERLRIPLGPESDGFLADLAIISGGTMSSLSPREKRKAQSSDRKRDKDGARKRSKKLKPTHDERGGHRHEDSPKKRKRKKNRRRDSDRHPR